MRRRDRQPLDPDDSTAGWVSQFEISDDALQSECNEIVEEQMTRAKQRQMLPPDCQWVIVNEKSDKFVWAATRAEKPPANPNVPYPA